MVFWKRKYAQSLGLAYVYDYANSRAVLDSWLELYAFTKRYKFVSGADNIILRVMEGALYPVESTHSGSGGDTWDTWSGYGSQLLMPDFTLWQTRFKYTGPIWNDLYHTYAKERLKIVSKNDANTKLEFTFSGAPSNYSYGGGVNGIQYVYYIGDLYVRIIKGTAGLIGNTLTISPDANNLIVVTVCKGKDVNEYWYGETYGFNVALPGTPQPYVTHMTGSSSHLVFRCVSSNNGKPQTDYVVYRDNADEVFSGSICLRFLADDLHYGGITNIGFFGLSEQNQVIAELGGMLNPFNISWNGTYTNTSFSSVFSWLGIEQRIRGGIYTNGDAMSGTHTMTMAGQTLGLTVYLFDKHIFIAIYSKARRTGDGLDLFERYASFVINMKGRIVEAILSYKSLKDNLEVYQQSGGTASLSFGDYIKPSRRHLNGSWQNYTRQGSSGSWYYEANGDERGHIGESETEKAAQTIGMILVNIYPGTWQHDFATYFNNGTQHEETALSPDIAAGHLDNGEEVHYAGFKTGTLGKGAGTSVVETLLGNPTFTTKTMKKGALLSGQVPWFHPASILYCIAWDDANSKYIIIDMTGTKVYE